MLLDMLPLILLLCCEDLWHEVSLYTLSIQQHVPVLFEKGAHLHQPMDWNTSSLDLVLDLLVVPLDLVVVVVPPVVPVLPVPVLCTRVPVASKI